MTLLLRRCGLALWALLMLSGCTTLPRVERGPIASQAIGVSAQTTLGRIATAYQPDRLHSGFRLMPLGTYSLEYITHLQTIATSVVLVGYCLWAFEKASMADTGIPWFQSSIVPFALAILRYSLLVDTGQGGAPEDVVMGDRTLQVFAAVWAVLFAAGVYVQ